MFNIDTRKINGKRTFTTKIFEIQTVNFIKVIDQFSLILLRIIP